jgi:hypothetical protein
MNTFNNSIAPRISDGGGEGLYTIAFKELLEFLPGEF